MVEDIDRSELGKQKAKRREINIAVLPENKDKDSKPHQRYGKSGGKKSQPFIISIDNPRNKPKQQKPDDLSGMRDDIQWISDTTYTPDEHGNFS